MPVLRSSDACRKFSGRLGSSLGIWWGNAVRISNCSMHQISKRQDKERSYKAHKYCNPVDILQHNMHIHILQNPLYVK